MIEVVIDSLRQSILHKDYFVIILKENNSGRYIPIGSSFYDFNALTIKLCRYKLPRPSTYDFFWQFVQYTNLSIRRVYIHSVVKGVYKAQVLGVRSEWGFRHGVVVDCRATDALLTAAHFQVPIFISPALLDHASITSLDELSSVIKGTASLVLDTPVSQAASDVTS